jgi:ABC-type antimicrobial peptide transport system permease subunit
MFKNYFKTGWRNISKLRFYSIINILGLSAGIAFVLLIGGYVWSEIQVNRSFKNANSLFALQSKWKSDATAKPVVGAPEPLPELLKRQYPDLVANYYRTLWRNTVVSGGDKYFRENVQVGDSSLINMFGLRLLHGNLNTLFKTPDAVVITAEKALKFFGTEDAVGKILTIENNEGSHKNFLVTGVLKNLPYNSVTTIRGADKLSVNSIFLPWGVLKSFYGETGEQNWVTYRNTYIELRKGIPPADLKEPIRQLLKLNTTGDVANDLQIDFLPLSGYYLDANNGTVRKLVYTVSFTALFILLMAIVNFINISIGSSTARLKEIGVRKVLGGSKRQLVFQFLTESVITVFIAVCLSIIMYLLIEPLFSEFIGKDIPSLFSFPLYFIGLPVFILVIGSVAGIYPAVVLSSVKAVESVKGKLSIYENISLRKILVALQFFIAISVFVSAIIINKQVNYFLNTDLGFDKEQIVNVPLPRNWTAEGVRKMEIIRDEIGASPGIQSASLCYSIPNRNSIDNPRVYRQGQDSSTAVETFTFATDENYAQTFGISLAAGHFFNPGNLPNDSSGIIINETSAKALGWNAANEAIGRAVKIVGDEKNYKVYGVVKDFHFDSKHEVIKPLMFSNIHNWNAYRFISIRLGTHDINRTIAGIQKKWSVLMPGQPFDYSFMDETLQITYSSEIQLKKASYMATTLSLVIVLLGITGMISLSIAKRTKEIGIRKVLGASVSSIMFLFIKEVLLVILLASLFAIPFAYIIMNTWLNVYAYRIKIGESPFIIVTATMIGLTGFLICIQTIRTAIANPVESLKTE